MLLFRAVGTNFHQENITLPSISITITTTVGVACDINISTTINSHSNGNIIA